MRPLCPDPDPPLLPAKFAMYPPFFKPARHHLPHVSFRGTVTCAERQHGHQIRLELRLCAVTCRAGRYLRQIVPILW